MAQAVSVYFAKAAMRSHPHNSAVFDIDGVREKQLAHSLVSCDPILVRRSTARLSSISALRAVFDYLKRKDRKR